ncbi:hypothetical protein DL766_009995 [Monosporascus sp. MC13-8B]|uniref:Uncharacterized protein n=1 Tax=Monosporascus cannonballus TaxID=155416 RepID=A0ABY0H8J3_9PEZI|nr:hypothetical protein DL762_005662 [Monosporascus cannonballus]RYO87061.1 hypothetical protein DL763_006504 [Monosporascus cannonballus]RYP12046.1 hypothetical protein DL766_009995 [Monosporascus sp. MC13-8B]
MSLTEAPTRAGNPGGHALDPRQETTGDPEVCGFKDRTSALRCPTGSSCMFNTDIYAVGCCKDDVCDWATTCCGWATTVDGHCGGPSAVYCPNPAYSQPDVAHCATARWEGGFTRNAGCAAASGVTDSYYFTTAGATTAYPGLPRLTGRSGTASPSGSEASTSGSSTNPGSSTDPGIMAGAVVGGVAAGVTLTIALLWMVKFFKKRRSDKGQVPQYPHYQAHAGAHVAPAHLPQELSP